MAVRRRNWRKKNGREGRNWKRRKGWKRKLLRGQRGKKLGRIVVNHLGRIRLRGRKVLGKSHHLLKKRAHLKISLQPRLRVRPVTSPLGQSTPRILRRKGRGQKRDLTPRTERNSKKRKQLQKSSQKEEPKTKQNAKLRKPRSGKKKRRKKLS